MTTTKDVAERIRTLEDRAFEQRQETRELFPDEYSTDGIETEKDVPVKVEDMEDGYDARNVIESKFQKKRRLTLENAIRLVEGFRWRFNYGDVQPIPTSDKTLQKVLGVSYAAKVSRVIENLMELGILSKVRQGYWSPDGEGVASQYAFNSLHYRRVCDYYRETYNSDPTSLASRKLIDNCRDSSPILEDLVIELSDETARRIGVRQRLNLDVTNIPDASIRAVLNETYPQFVEGKEIAERLNDRLPEAERIKWEWNLHKASQLGRIKLTKIGFRASSIACSFKSEDKRHVKNDGIWRKNYLDDRFRGNYCHYDFNASIWRLTYNLNHDDVLPSCVDAYTVANGGEFKDKVERDAFKKLAMRLYFCTREEMGHKIECYLQKMRRSVGEIGEYDEFEKNQIDRIMVKAKDKALEGMGGFFYGSEIFLHESFIYLKMLEELIERTNGKVVQVYDSFYYPSGCGITNNDIEEIYARQVKDYKERFSDTFHTSWY